jgi:hypothetical protein
VCTSCFKTALILPQAIGITDFVCEKLEANRVGSCKVVGDGEVQIAGLNAGVATMVSAG